MKDISGKLRKARIKQLENLIDSYERSLKRSRDSETIENLNGLIKKAKKDIKDLNNLPN